MFPYNFPIYAKMFHIINQIFQQNDLDLYKEYTNRYIVRILLEHFF